MKDICIKEEGKIIIDIDVLQEVSTCILENLKDIDLLRVYFYLDEIYGKGNRNIIKDLVYESGNKSLDHKTIKKQYQVYLEASGRAKTTIKDYAREVERFLNYLKDSSIVLSSLKIDVVNLYLSEEKSKRNLSTNSYSKLVVVLRSFLSHIYKYGKFHIKDISRDLNVPKRVDKEREYLTGPEIDRIIVYLDGRRERYIGENIRDKLIFYLGINCGLRKSEIAKLNWENVDLAERKIKILDAKGGKERIVYYSQELGKVIEDYRKSYGNSSGALVRGSFGKRITSCPMHRIIRRMYVESGIYRGGLTIHSLRHTYAENLRKNGVDLKVIKTLLGHSSLATTDRYLHVSSEDLKKATI